MVNRITHKVGVKILSEQQLENVLPTYENLFHKIDTCRQVAKMAMAERWSDKTTPGKRHYQYNFMYDNVFSVLGRRGTGKTSVAFTLRELIKEKYIRQHYDVIMPLIIPEVIPEDCTILGWLLAIVKDEIELLENKIPYYEDNKSEQFWERCKYPERNKKEISLTNQLEELSQLFYAKGYNPGTETSYDRAINNSARQAEDYYMFAAKIAKLWDAWVDRIHHFWELKNPQASKDESCCPMIYFIFDDVDLAPEKIEELLSVIIKYLSHPNIVVITTADEELFLEVLENRLDKKIGRYPRDLRNFLKGSHASRESIWEEAPARENLSTREDVISQTARMYLGKVLPTSTRFYLRLFNTAEEKAAFYVEDEKRLGEGVADQVQKLIDCKKKSKTNSVTNFMRADNRIINYYLKFMGNTSRQIGNVYIAMQDLVDNLCAIACQTGKKYSNERRLRQIYTNCRYFICVALNANHTLSNLVGRVESFVDEVFLYEYNQWKMYCDYTYVNNYLHNKLEEESKSVKVGIGLQIFSLLSFVENIMLIMEQLVPDGITHRMKSHEAQYLAEYVGSVSFGSRTVFRTDLDSRTFIKHYLELLNRLEAIVEEEMPDVKFNIEYFYNFRYYSEMCTLQEVKRLHRDNRRWFDEMTRMLCMVYGNVYLFGQNNMEDCLIYPGRTYLIRYQKRIDTEIKDNIRDCFQELYTQRVWPRMYAELGNLQDKLLRESGDFADFVAKVYQEFSKQNAQNVTLRQVLDAVLKHLPVEGTDGVMYFISHCPREMRDEFLKNWNEILTNSNATRSLLIEYTQQVRKVSVGGSMVLNDVSNAVEVLQICAGRCAPLSEHIHEIAQLLLEGPENPRDDMKLNLIMDRATGTEFIRILKSIHKFLLEGDKTDFYFENDNEDLIDRIKELFQCMDILVLQQAVPASSPPERFQNAVRLAFQVTAVKFLQKIYIWQTIHEKYEKRHSMSSWGLEKVRIDGTMRDTYYYQFYQHIERLTNTITKDQRRGRLNVRDEDIKDDIRITYTSARSHYVDQLIERAENE